MHHKLIKIAECLICEVDKQMDHLDCVDTKELGEAIDMIKDLSKAIYYDVVTEAMLEVDELDSESVHEEKKVHHMKEEHKEMSAHKSYLEAKAKNADKAILMKELEKYMQEIASCVLDIVKDASPEEKQYLNKKITALANRIV